MTSNILRPLIKNGGATALNVMPPLSRTASVSTLRGQPLNIPEHQVPLSNPNCITNNLWGFNADGNYNTALQNGGIQNIKIVRGQGSGRTRGKVWLRMNITNSSTTLAVQTAPAPFFFQQIQFQTPGGDIIQQRDPFELWFCIISTTSESEWFSMSDLVLASNGYESGPALQPSTTYDVWIPLVGNPYSCGEIPTAVLEGDSMCYLNFAPPTTSVISGPTNALVINSLSLQFEMENLDSSLVTSLQDEYKSFAHSVIYPRPQVMSFTQTWNVNSQYTFQMSGITGDVTFLLFVLRNSLQGQDTYHGQHWNSFQIQDQQGIPISGAQFVPESYNRWGQLPQWALGTWMQDRRYGAYNFSIVNSALPEFLVTGRKNGAFGFSGMENFVINTAGAGTNEVLTFNSTVSSTLAGGSWSYFTWTDQYGLMYSTTAFDMSTQTAGSLQSLIEGIESFEGTVAVAISSTNPFSFTVTFGGNYGNRPITGAGFSLKLVGVMQYATGSPSQLRDSVSVPGVRGITNGNTYTLSIFAFASSILSISSNMQGGVSGRQKVQNS